MTVTAVKTKAEQEFGRRFEAMAGELVGGGWVADLRREAIGAFATLGLPGSRGEAWKYTDLRRRMSDVYPTGDGSKTRVDARALDKALGAFGRLDADRLVLVNGAYRADLSLDKGLQAGCEFIALAGLLAKAPSWFAGKFSPGRVGAYDGVTALNAAFMTDGVMVKVKPGEAVERPILVVHVRAGDVPVAAFSRNFFAIEAGASATLVEVFVSLEGAREGQGNSFADVTVGAGGRLTHAVCRIGDGREQDVAHTIATVEAGGDYQMFQVLAGGGLVRHQTVVRMAGEGGNGDVCGVLLGKGRDHVDISLLVDHEAGQCRSREFVKAVLAGQARGVFQGKAVVRPGAQKTDGHMIAQALMLGQDAEFDSKPELEIYADDVQCGHGSTCADIDPELVFFCQARGLSEAEAKALLVRGFVGEVIEKIGDDAVRGCFDEITENWLADAQF